MCVVREKRKKIKWVIINEIYQRLLKKKHVLFRSLARSAKKYLASRDREKKKSIARVKKPL